MNCNTIENDLDKAVGQKWKNYFSINKKGVQEFNFLFISILERMYFRAYWPSWRSNRQCVLGALLPCKLFDSKNSKYFFNCSEN